MSTEISRRGLREEIVLIDLPEEEPSGEPEPGILAPSGESLEGQPEQDEAAPSKRRRRGGRGAPSWSTRRTVGRVWPRVRLIWRMLSPLACSARMV